MWRFSFNAMHVVTGEYAKPISVVTWSNPDCISNGISLEDFGHDHPHPNLQYAKGLVEIMYAENVPDLGAASSATWTRLERSELDSDSCSLWT